MNTPASYTAHHQPPPTTTTTKPHFDLTIPTTTATATTTTTTTASLDNLRRDISRYIANRPCIQTLELPFPAQYRSMLYEKSHYYELFDEYTQSRGQLLDLLGRLQTVTEAADRQARPLRHTMCPTQLELLRLAQQQKVLREYTEYIVMSLQSVGSQLSPSSITHLYPALLQHICQLLHTDYVTSIQQQQQQLIATRSATGGSATAASSSSSSSLQDTDDNNTASSSTQHDNVITQALPMPATIPSSNEEFMSSAIPLNTPRRELFTFGIEVLKWIAMPTQYSPPHDKTAQTNTPLNVPSNGTTPASSLTAAAVASSGSAGGGGPKSKVRGTFAELRRRTSVAAAFGSPSSDAASDNIAAAAAAAAALTSTANVSSPLSRGYQEAMASAQDPKRLRRRTSITGASPDQSDQELFTTGDILFEFKGGGLFIHVRPHVHTELWTFPLVVQIIHPLSLSDSFVFRIDVHQASLSRPFITEVHNPAFIMTLQWALQLARFNSAQELSNSGTNGTSGIAGTSTTSSSTVSTPSASNSSQFLHHNKNSFPTPSSLTPHRFAGGNIPPSSTMIASLSHQQQQYQSDENNNDSDRDPPTLRLPASSIVSSQHPQHQHQQQTVGSPVVSVHPAAGGSASLGPLSPVASPATPALHHSRPNQHAISGGGNHISHSGAYPPVPTPQNDRLRGGHGGGGGGDGGLFFNDDDELPSATTGATAATHTHDVMSTSVDITGELLLPTGQFSTLADPSDIPLTTPHRRQLAHSYFGGLPDVNLPPTAAVTAAAAAAAGSVGSTPHHRAIGGVSVGAGGPTSPSSPCFTPHSKSSNKTSNHHYPQPFFASPQFRPMDDFDPNTDHIDPNESDEVTAAKDLAILPFSSHSLQHVQSRNNAELGQPLRIRLFFGLTAYQEYLDYVHVLTTSFERSGRPPLLSLQVQTAFAKSHASAKHGYFSVPSSPSATSTTASFSTTRGSERFWHSRQESREFVPQLFDLSSYQSQQPNSFDQRSTDDQPTSSKSLLHVQSDHMDSFSSTTNANIFHIDDNNTATNAKHDINSNNNNNNNPIQHSTTTSSHNNPSRGGNNGAILSSSASQSTSRQPQHNNDDDTKTTSSLSSIKQRQLTQVEIAAARYQAAVLEKRQNHVFNHLRNQDDIIIVPLDSIVRYNTPPAIIEPSLSPLASQQQLQQSSFRSQRQAVVVTTAAEFVQSDIPTATEPLRVQVSTVESIPVQIAVPDTPRAELPCVAPSPSHLPSSSAGITPAPVPAPAAAADAAATGGDIAVTAEPDSKASEAVTTQATSAHPTSQPEPEQQPQPQQPAEQSTKSSRLGQREAAAAAISLLLSSARRGGGGGGPVSPPNAAVTKPESSHANPTAAASATTAVPLQYQLPNSTTTTNPTISSTSTALIPASSLTASAGGLPDGLSTALSLSPSTIPPECTCLRFYPSTHPALTLSFAALDIHKIPRLEHVNIRCLFNWAATGKHEPLAIVLFLCERVANELRQKAFQPLVEMKNPRDPLLPISSQLPQQVIVGTPSSLDLEFSLQHQQNQQQQQQHPSDIISPSDHFPLCGDTNPPAINHNGNIISIDLYQLWNTDIVLYKTALDRRAAAAGGVVSSIDTTAFLLDLPAGTQFSASPRSGTAAAAVVDTHAAELHDDEFFADQDKNPTLLARQSQQQRQQNSKINPRLTRAGSTSALRSESESTTFALSSIATPTAAQQNQQQKAQQLDTSPLSNPSVLRFGPVPPLSKGGESSAAISTTGADALATATITPPTTSSVTPALSTSSASSPADNSNRFRSPLLAKAKAEMRRDVVPPPSRHGGGSGGLGGTPRKPAIYATGSMTLPSSKSSGGSDGRHRASRLVPQFSSPKSFAGYCEQFGNFFMPRWAYRPEITGDVPLGFEAWMETSYLPSNHRAKLPPPPQQQQHVHDDSLTLDGSIQSNTTVVSTSEHLAAIRHQEVPAALFCSILAQINSTDFHGWTALMYACFYGNMTCVKLLLRFGADPLVVSPIDGATALFVAMDQCHFAICDLLVSIGVSLHEPQPHLTPLMFAAKTGNLMACDYLVNHAHQISLDTTSLSDGYTALSLAAILNHYKLVDLLLMHKADPNIQSYEGYTALMLACSLDNDVIVQLLIEYGAFVHTSTHVGINALICAITPSSAAVLQRKRDRQHQHRIQQQQRASSQATTPLVAPNGMVVALGPAAAAASSTSIPPSTTRNHHLALVHAPNYNTIELLLEHNASPNAARHRGSITPLIAAVLNNDVFILRTLIGKYHANVNEIDYQGRTALMYACSTDTTTSRIVAENSTQIVKLLLDSKAQLNICDNDGKTASYIASDSGNHHLVRHLFQLGAKRCYLFERTNEALQLAVLRCNNDTIVKLLNGGANVNLHINMARVFATYPIDEPANIDIFMIDDNSLLQQQQHDGSNNNTNGILLHRSTSMPNNVSLDRGLELFPTSNFTSTTNNNNNAITTTTSNYANLPRAQQQQIEKNIIRAKTSLLMDENDYTILMYAIEKDSMIIGVNYHNLPSRWYDQLLIDRGQYNYYNYLNNTALYARELGLDSVQDDLIAHTGRAPLYTSIRQQTGSALLTQQQQQQQHVPQQQLVSIASQISTPLSTTAALSATTAGAGSHSSHHHLPSQQQHQSRVVPTSNDAVAFRLYYLRHNIATATRPPPFLFAMSSPRHLPQLPPAVGGGGSGTGDMLMYRGDSGSLPDVDSGRHSGGAIAPAPGGYLALPSSALQSTALSSPSHNGNSAIAPAAGTAAIGPSDSSARHRPFSAAISQQSRRSHSGPHPPVSTMGLDTTSQSPPSNLTVGNSNNNAGGGSTTPTPGTTRFATNNASNPSHGMAGTGAGLHLPPPSHNGKELHLHITPPPDDGASESQLTIIAAAAAATHQTALPEYVNRVLSPIHHYNSVQYQSNKIDPKVNRRRSQHLLLQQHQQQALQLAYPMANNNNNNNSQPHDGNNSGTYPVLELSRSHSHDATASGATTTASAAALSSGGGGGDGGPAVTFCHIQPASRGHRRFQFLKGSRRNGPELYNTGNELGWRPMIDTLLKMHADVDDYTSNSGLTALMLCAKYNRRDLAKILIREPHLANINARDNLGRSVLGYAKLEGNHALAEWLISQGALD